MLSGPRGRLMYKAVRIYIITSTVISGLIALFIILSAIIWPMWTGNPDKVPKFIESWGGVIVGFYFGSFLTLLTKIVESGEAKEIAAAPTVQAPATKT